MKKSYIYCRQQNKEIYDDEPCWYQQGIVTDPLKICFKCVRYRAMHYDEQKKSEIKETKSSQKPKLSKRMKDDSKKRKGKRAKILKTDYPWSHLLDYRETPGIYVMLPNPSNPNTLYPWPMDRMRDEAPFRLVDAIKDGLLTIKISTDHKRESLVQNFKKFMTLVDREIKKHGIEKFPKKDKYYELKTKIYELKRKGWSFYKIGNKLFPDNPEGRRRAKFFYDECKKMMEK